MIIFARVKVEYISFRVMGTLSGYACFVPVGAPTVTGTAHLFILAYYAYLVNNAKKRQRREWL